MTLKFLDLYNAVAEQAWSMFDPDADSKEDFESGLKSSINKALSALWLSYPFSFRQKTKKIVVSNGKAKYSLPNGNIIKKYANGTQHYAIKIDKDYLDYIDDYETLDEEKGKPHGFYVKGDNIYLYPTPDKAYNLEIEYNMLALGLSQNGDILYELIEDDDYINIPEKYEVIFKNCLITLSMMYAIADETDENYTGYKQQYDDAYKILINYQKGIDLEKRKYW